jgi:hypothetical protein
MSRRIVTAAIALLLTAAILPAQQSNPLVGKWKTNVAKSKYVLGGTGIQQTVQYELVSGGAIRYSSDRVKADGTKSRNEFTAFLNGSTSPYLGVAGRDAIKINKIDPNTYQVTYLNKGQVVQINYWTVSRDGRTLTTVSTGVASDNTVYSRVVVADKQ